MSNARRNDLGERITPEKERKDQHKLENCRQLNDLQKDLDERIDKQMFFQRLQQQDMNKNDAIGSGLTQGGLTEEDFTLGPKNKLNKKPT